jgi:hypothetical protein
MAKSPFQSALGSFLPVLKTSYGFTSLNNPAAAPLKMNFFNRQEVYYGYAPHTGH